MSQLLLASEAYEKSNEASINKIIPLIEEAIKNAKYGCDVPLEYLMPEVVKQLEKAGYFILTATECKGYGKVSWLSPET